MDIGNALRRTNRDDITIRSIIANTISEFYTHKLHIGSVKVHGNKVIISTGNPLINSELQLLSGDIKKASLKKLRDMGIQIGEDIRLIFR